MKIWIDIENPPQVQYLSPFVDAFAQRGYEVKVTARDYGATAEMLRSRGVDHELVGRGLPASRSAKLRGTAVRAARLAARMRRRPGLLLSTSRSAAMASWMLRVPSFMVLDYEHAELSSFRVFGTTVLHPSVIPAQAFLGQRFPASRLVPFDGLKEDISFSPVLARPHAAFDFGQRRSARSLVLVRPPSETSHYFDAASRALTDEVLAHLSRENELQVVFSPRAPQQESLLYGRVWRHEPIVLDRAVDFMSLLNAVDGVVCSGGTMLREAAYLGIPAVSIFGGQIGAVDRWLESVGAVRLIHEPGELDAVDWTAPRRAVIPHRPELIDELVDQMLRRATVPLRLVAPPD